MLPVATDYLEPTDPEGGGVALLTIDGDPVAVYDDLARQARQAGFEQAFNSSEACAFLEGDLDDPYESAHQLDGVEVKAVSCYASSFVVDVPEPYGFAMELHAGRYPSSGYVSHAVVLQAHHPPKGTAPVAGEGSRPRLTLAPPERSPARAEVGELFIGSQRKGLRVREGSELVAPPAPGFSSGWFALFRITGDARAVFDGYLDDVASYVDMSRSAVERLPGRRAGGFEVVRRKIDVLAGGSSTMVALYLPDRAEQETWLLIDHRQC